MIENHHRIDVIVRPNENVWMALLSISTNNLHQWKVIHEWLADSIRINDEALEEAKDMMDIALLQGACKALRTILKTEKEAQTMLEKKRHKKLGR